MWFRKLSGVEYLFYIAFPSREDTVAVCDYIQVAVSIEAMYV